MPSFKAQDSGVTSETHFSGLKLDTPQKNHNRLRLSHEPLKLSSARHQVFRLCCPFAFVLVFLRNSLSMALNFHPLLQAPTCQDFRHVRDLSFTFKCLHFCTAKLSLFSKVTTKSYEPDKSIVMSESWQRR